MALTEETKCNQVEVLEDGQLQVRMARIIYDDGVELTRTYIRKVIDVGDDVSGEDQMVKDLAGVMHTPERKTKRDTVKAAQAAKEEEK